HRHSEPAIQYADGFGLYALNGLLVDQHIARGEFTAFEIDKVKNIELRRVMLNRYGVAKYLQETGAHIIDQDEQGVLYMKVPMVDESIVMVEVTNSTPDADGTFRKYFLRVPPHIRKVKEAVAWTFGMNSSEYSPTEES
ncbi:MAG: hypothetical protein K2Z81_11800, partial [Cyanobacteria bacterium]|nr:hypothetical protein [Cyanobacteriota bacterium]